VSYQLLRCVYDDWVEDQRHGILQQISRLQRGVDLVLLGVRHEGVGERKRPCAVRHDGDLVAAELVAIESGCLSAGGGRSRMGRREDRSRAHDRRGGGGSAPEHGTTGEFGHGFLPLAAPARAELFVSRLVSRDGNTRASIFSIIGTALLFLFGF